MPVTNFVIPAKAGIQKIKHKRQKTVYRIINTNLHKRYSPGGRLFFTSGPLSLDLEALERNRKQKEK
jgi:hypothetical protein